jgi:predicted glycosyltransferase
MADGKPARILIYSHDSFGLGHLRRCREIAHAIVEDNPDASVLILSGSPIIGNFDFRSRVDFVRIPGVIKLRNGEYTSLKLPLAIEQTMAMRAAIIRHTAESFAPDLFLVDKEPLGLRGEVRETLAYLNDRGVPCILGLRDVMDDPRALAEEWRRKQAVPALSAYYDAIWVYGLPQICQPLDGLDLPASVTRRMVYTGYLPREAAADAPKVRLEKIRPPYILVTVGGGGDGEAIIDWVLRAYESGTALPYPALLVLGPFMGSDHQNDFLDRAEKLDDVEAITFDAHIEGLLTQAVGVVGMGGYNTFCEILSFDKRALIVPRVAPRREQYIRASQAARLDLVRVLADDGVRQADRMATALRTLPQQPLPSAGVIPGLLEGRRNVAKLVRQWIDAGRGNLDLAASTAQPAAEARQAQASR